MDTKLELLFRAVCAYERDGVADFALRDLDFFGHENTVRRNLEKIEGLSRDGIPYLVQINLNGRYSRFKVSHVLECPRFIFNKDLSVTYKVMLLKLYALPNLPEVLTVHNVCALTGMAYNTIKNNFDDKIRENMDCTPIKLSLADNAEVRELGAVFIGNKRTDYKCKYCGDTNQDNFYKHSHTVCNKCRQLHINDDMAGKLYKNSRQSYKNRPHIKGYDLTKEYIQQLLDKQHYKCYYTGVDFRIGNKLTNPTIDRIDSSKGYVQGNVVICTEVVNSMKNDMSLEEFGHQVNLLSENFFKRN